MSIRRSLTLGLRKLLRRDAIGRDVDDELSHDEALAADDLVRRGVPPDAARRVSASHGRVTASHGAPRGADR